MKRLISICLFSFLSLLFISPSCFAAVYKIDADHTTVTFKIRHLLSNVTGYFNKFEGTVNYDPKDLSTWSVDATVQADSIDTNVEARDKHLKSKDFFDVEKFPALTFKSTGVKNATEKGGDLEGVLTIHGVEKPVTFKLEALGVASDPWGNTIASFTATTKINRKDFGLNWNQAVETGQFLVGEEVDIILEVAALLQE